MSQSRAATPAWSLPRRVAFRFLFAYSILFGFPFPLGEIPGTTSLTKRYSDLWDAIVPWVGNHLLHIQGEIATADTGSGDRTYDYIKLLSNLALATAATLVWSLADRRSTQYPRLREGLRVYLRYFLGVMMLGYGLGKIFKLQFPFLSPIALFQTWGESSPMRLLWGFMGYSTPYNIFTGAAEAVGGLLVFFRRTTTLGALMIATVMSNVVMLNFCYDVPVKLLSSHLLLMAVVLLLPDLRRLANLLILHRPVTPAPLRAPFDARWMERGRTALKLLFIGSVLVTATLGMLELREEMGIGAPTTPLAGGYQVESFVKAGGEGPPLIPDKTRWRRVFIFPYGEKMGMAVRLINDERTAFEVDHDPAKSTLTLSLPSGEKAEMAYTKPDPERLVLTGSYMNETLSVDLRKIDMSKLPLNSRGFRWISEVPYNR